MIYIYQAKKLIKTDDLILFCFLFVSDINIKESSKQRAPAFTFGNRWDMSKKTQWKKKFLDAQWVRKYESFRHIVILCHWCFINSLHILLSWFFGQSYHLYVAWFSFKSVPFIQKNKKINRTHCHENHAT